MANQKIVISTFIFVLIQFLVFPALAFEAWWQCSSRKGGDWTFGRAPSICLVDHMQTQDAVKNQYSPVLFDDPSSRNVERRRYMTELNAVAKEMAQFYLRRRKPNVGNEELKAFTKALLTLMHQETFWTHFRVSNDQRVRYMRGDSGHGHGIMQVDDRSHQAALLDGQGVDLVYNMVYGLDVFFEEWERAPQQSCVSSPSNYRDRTRSAWSAYNGGPGRICRWTNSTGPFAHHDKQFLDKLNSQSFKNWVTDEELQTSLNISCLVDGIRPCANTGSVPVEPINDQIYQYEDFYCKWGDSLSCVQSLNDLNCLAIADNKDYVVQGIVNEGLVSGRPVAVIDRNELCLEHVNGLLVVSQKVELKKNINIRQTPGGELLATSKNGLQTRILDFQVTTSDDQKRYYKINSNGVEGYVYAGNMNSFLDWVAPIDEGNEVDSILGSVGGEIEIVAKFGINLRKTPGGSLIVRVPREEKLEVLDRVVQGTKNYLYYKVSYAGSLGYIYSGYLDDLDTMSTWTSVVRPQNLLSLSPDVPFRFLKSCPEAQCKFEPRALRQGSDRDQLVLLETRGEWVLVENLDRTKRGWIRSSDIVEN